MYEWWIKNSFSKSMRTSLTTFHSGFIGYALFSNLDGIKSLHSHTLDYVNFFLDKVNFLNLWYALSLAVIVISYFLVAFTLYAIFDATFNKTKNMKIRNMLETIFNIIIWIWFSGFWIAIFSPHLEYTRELYNYYHVMLWIEIMLIALSLLVVTIIGQFVFNTYKPPIALFDKFKSSKKSTAVANTDYEEFSDEWYNESVVNSNYWTEWNFKGSYS